MLVGDRAVSSAMTADEGLNHAAVARPRASWPSFSSIFGVVLEQMSAWNQTAPRTRW